MQANDCAICGVEGVGTDDAPPELTVVCPECARKVPSSLVKACYDQFDYLLGLVDGTIIRFSSAEIHGDWVCIRGMTDQWGETPFREQVFGHSFPRGLDLRLDRIAWCADAPDGS